MRAVVATCGGYGDTLPFIALACKLKDRDHEVSLLAPSNFTDFAEQFELDFYGINFPLRDLVSEKSPLKSANSTERVKITAAVISDYHDELALACSRMQRHADIVAYHYPLILGEEFAKYLDALAVPTCLEPFYVPTRPDLTTPKTSGASDFINHFSTLHNYANRHRKNLLHKPCRPQFRDLVLHPGRIDSPVFQAFSKHAIAPPNDYTEGVYTTNFWFLQTSPSWQPPENLADFLKYGSTPICVQFGSEVNEDSGRTTSHIIEAARIAGVRAVLVGGLGGIKNVDVDNNFFFVQEVPMSWLLPKVSAVVHHGGIGSSSTALKAGKPQIICPVHGQHTYFAKRMASLGVACDPIPYNQLTPRQIADAIHQALTDSNMAKNVEKAAREVNATDGTKTAVKILEELTTRT